MFLPVFLCIVIIIIILYCVYPDSGDGGGSDFNLMADPKNYNGYITTTIQSLLKYNPNVNYEQYRDELALYIQTQKNRFANEPEQDILNRLYAYLMAISGTPVQKGSITTIAGKAIYQNKSMETVINDLITNATVNFFKNKSEQLKNPLVVTIQNSAIQSYLNTGYDFKTLDDLSDLVYGYLKGQYQRNGLLK